jgi:hypothetical protein
VGLPLSAGTEVAVPSPFGTIFSPALAPSRTFCAERRPTDKNTKRKAATYFLKGFNISKLPHSFFTLVLLHPLSEINRKKPYKKKHQIKSRGGASFVPHISTALRSEAYNKQRGTYNKNRHNVLPAFLKRAATVL